MSVLVLNATYEVLGVTTWKRAVWLVAIGRCDLLERRIDGTIRTGGGAEYPIPSVVRLREMVHVPRACTVPPTRAAIFARDRGECQVRGCERAATTIDHLVPRSRGGGTDWQNVALMCQRHNQQKADRSLQESGLSLKRPPRPITIEIVLVAHCRPEWGTWLGLDAVAS